MKCLKCGRESKKGELVFSVYEIRGDGTYPRSSQWPNGFVHMEYPVPIGCQMHAAMERINEDRRKQEIARS